jgi:tetratricopeptide (TPR) repeat protein
MAARKNKQAIIEERTSEVLSNRDLFADQSPTQLSEQDVFAGDQNFYKLLTDSAQTTSSRQDLDTKPGQHTLIRVKRFLTLQKILVGSIIVISVALLYTVLKTPSKHSVNAEVSDGGKRPAVIKTVAGDLSATRMADLPQASGKVIEKGESVVQTPQPLSLKVADTFYLQKNYDKAYTAYKQLHQSVLTSNEEELMRDYLQLRMALCIGQTADSDQAGRIFRTLLQSRSPAVRLFANYYMALLEVEAGQYLKARSRAYQTIALTGAVELDKNRSFTIHRDCHFIAAEAITRNILSLCNADKELPKGLWSHSDEFESLTNLDEQQLRTLLSSGSEQLSKGVLGPQIQRLERQGSSYWSVTCQGASIEELLARFAADAGIDISWVLNRSATTEGTEDSFRKRPVCMCLPAVTMLEVVTVAAGHVGLLGRFDDKKILKVFDPADYTSLSEHLSLLIPEAISLWQGFLLAFHDDQRIPNAHFALGLLQTQKGQMAEAIAEYKLVANRFSQTPLAPFALLNSSKLKAGLHDYAGAREDLRRLVEQYPDNEFYGQACLQFADTTMQAGLWDEAVRLYRKVYNLGLSQETQIAASLGAARCCYEKQDYAGASEWSTRYVELVGTSKTSPAPYGAGELPRVYFILGKANLALGRLQEACDAFEHTLAGQLSRDEYVETISALVEAKVQQGQLIEALEVLENLRSWQFPQQQYIKILLLRSKILRSMGLADRAIATLGDSAEYLTDPQLKAKVSFELAECSAAKGNLEEARSQLTEILALVEPGPLAHEVAVKLADVCLKLGQDAQTISICLQLLDSGPSAQVKQKALNILTTAYQQQKNYDKAALALLGQWDKTDTLSPKNK